MHGNMNVKLVSTSYNLSQIFTNSFHENANTHYLISKTPAISQREW